ncbi:MAG TPA: AMP-binding protein, partial [Phycisphaerae bacterium]
MSAAEILWRPSPERVRGSQMYDFLDRVADRFGIAREWESLRGWAIEQRAAFWPEFLQYAGIQLSAPWSQVYRGVNMYDCEWFAGAKLNYARHLLRFDDDRLAIISEDERGLSASYTYRQLRLEVARCAHALRREGVKIGDRVVGYLPNIPETVIAMLATVSLGAIWSSCSPDFGIQGVLDRFGQIEPVVLFTADGYTYNGKAFDSLERVRGILDKLPSVRRVVVVPFLNVASPLVGGAGAPAPGTKPDATGLRTARTWRDFLGPVDTPAPPLTFEEVPFDHPLFIMYSSGTTGLPKCMVHGHGGTLLQHMKELM